MLPEEFDSIAEKAYQDLPEKYKDLLEKHGVTIVVRDTVPSGVFSKGSKIFGCYRGITLAKRLAAMNCPCVETIEIYQDAFESSFHNENDICREVNRTILHEIGHFLGMDHPHLATIGL